MTAFKSLAIAILKGFRRDRASVFFALIFPLMFLVLFGGIFNTSSAPKTELIVIGKAPLIDDLKGDAAKGFRESFEVSHSDSRADALKKVRKGDADAAVEQIGDVLRATYTEADRVQAATVQATLAFFVDAANVAATGQPPKYTLDSNRVEDESLSVIDFMTPGLLGWALAMSASFGAASTLQGWRQSKLLRRLQLAPVSTTTVVGARIVATLVIACVQTAVFLGIGSLFFDLHLTGWWPLVVPMVAAATLCFMAVGLLAGAIAKTTEGAVNFANFIVLPMAFLSGSFFPLDDAPRWLKIVSHLLPLHHLNKGLTDVMVRGDGPSAVVLPLVILLAFAAVVTLVAAKLFRWDSV